jgi:hypothetical protein
VFDGIVCDDPTEGKGFYRVARQLPSRERLTGLAAAAFRALEEGKWSAETPGSFTALRSIAFRSAECSAAGAFTALSTYSSKSIDGWVG